MSGHHTVLSSILCNMLFEIHLEPKELNHKLQHLAVPYVSVWRLIAMWLRVSPYGATFHGDSESLPFRMGLPVAVTKGRFTHSMPCPCRARSIPLPCRTAKDLEGVFPI